MPSRKSVWPGNAQKDRRKEPKPQSVFTDVFEDCPPTQVPNDAIAKAINGWPIGMGFRSRWGTKLYGEPYPAIEDRTGYAAHKVGNQIISDSGDIFTQADVSNIWVWDNGLTDEMTGYVDAHTMACRDDDYNAGVNCHVQGKCNLNQWHEKQEVWVLQLGQDFYVADRGKTTYTKVLIFGADLPANAISEMIADDTHAIVCNSRYAYRILLDKTPIRAYPINTPIPMRRIQSNDLYGEKHDKYHFIYSVALLDGQGNFINRETRANGNYSVKMLTESGTNIIDNNRRDWAIVNTDKQIGPRSDTYGVLDGAVLPAAWNTPAAWTGIADLTLRINICGLGLYEIVTDATLIANFTELAERLQASFRLYFPSATVEYLTDASVGPHIRITSGLVKGGTVSFALEGVTGTPSAANLGLTQAAGAVQTNPYVGVPHIIRGLYVPTRQYVTGTQYQWHWSHFPIYRTPDIGPEGITDESRKGSIFYSHLNDRGKRVVNSPDEFIWEKDLRIAGAFYARRINGFIELWPTVLGGEFELADEGSVVEFEDGSRVEISYNGYINSKLVRYSDVDYYYEETPWMAACIGNGKAVRITQNGTTITRVPGSHTDSYTAWTAADERRPIWLTNGTIDYIREVVDANTIIVYGTRVLGTTGLTYTPSYRNYNSAIYDDTLFNHASGWMCKNRFMREVEPSNSVSRQPGYFLFAARGSKTMRYCPLEYGYKQFVGYHNREYQAVEVDDVIERMIGFANRYAILCKGSIYAGATNNATVLTLPETFQDVFILSGAERAAKVGLINYGSLDWIDEDWVRFITNTGELRDFNGLQFRLDGSGEPVDYSVDRSSGLKRFKSALEKAYKEFNAKYARGVGFVQWWKEL